MGVLFNIGGKEIDDLVRLFQTGQGHDTAVSFIIAAVGVILFLLAAGVVAMRKRSQPA